MLLELETANLLQFVFPLTLFAFISFFFSLICCIFFFFFFFFLVGGGESEGGREVSEGGRCQREGGEPGERKSPDNWT